jgi:WD repeat-containing protein 1 (actin-interacting protein 1)
LAWDSESKRILAVGDGRERFGHAFSFDTGSSVGEISGHSKAINSVAVRPIRPFRAVTASDDGSLVFLHGTPYKFSSTIKTHSAFVHSVAYSPDGQTFASAGADRKMFLYDGTTGDLLKQLGEGEHKGGIYAVSFSPDSKLLASSSGDSTVKLWDVQASKLVEYAQFHPPPSPFPLAGCVCAMELNGFGKKKTLHHHNHRTWSFTSDSGPAANGHQVGNTWASENTIVSLSFAGEINVIDRRVPGKPSNVIHGRECFLPSPCTSSPACG